jgi:hypothetical protein
MATIIKGDVAIVDGEEIPIPSFKRVDVIKQGGPYNCGNIVEILFNTNLFSSKKGIRRLILDNALKIRINEKWFKISNPKMEFISFDNFQDNFFKIGHKTFELMIDYVSDIEIENKFEFCKEDSILWIVIGKDKSVKINE